MVDSGVIHPMGVFACELLLALHWIDVQCCWLPLLLDSTFAGWLAYYNKFRSIQLMMDLSFSWRDGILLDVAFALFNFCWIQVGGCSEIVNIQFWIQLLLLHPTFAELILLDSTFAGLHFFAGCILMTAITSAVHGAVFRDSHHFSIAWKHGTFLDDCLSWQPLFLNFIWQHCAWFLHIDFAGFKLCGAKGIWCKRCMVWRCPVSNMCSVKLCDVKIVLCKSCLV